MTHTWQLPEPLSVFAVEVADETEVVVRQHGQPNGSRLVLSHGNGLAIDFYYPFWSLLEDEFELFVFDFRNHGWNEVSGLGNHNVVSMVTDLDLVLNAIEARFDTKPITGVFHSLSSLTALLFSSELIELFSSRASRGFDGLVLFDPPLHSPGKSHAEFDDDVERTAKARRNRTEKFRTLEQFVELLEFFPTYSHLVPGAKELMASTTLKQTSSNDGYELRCPADYEARAAQFVRAFADDSILSHLPCPTRIIGADPLMPATYLPTMELSELTHVDFDFVPETTHYMQIEKPAVCAKYVRDFVNRQIT